MATSQKQIESNRRNAQLSTGPKTLEGKSRSSRNALKHGYKAIVVSKQESSPEVEAARTAWINTFQPRNPVALGLADWSFRCHRRLLFVVEAEESAVARQIEEASEAFAETRQNDFNVARQELLNDPVRNHPILAATHEGSRELLRLSTQLYEVLDSNEWIESHHRVLLAVQGKPVTELDESLRQWSRELVAFNTLEVRLLDPDLGIPRPDFREIPDPLEAEAELREWLATLKQLRLDTQRHRDEFKPIAEAARQGIRKRVDQVVAEHRALVAQLEGEDARSLQTVIDISKVDTTHEGRLLRRYIGEASRELLRSVKAAQAATGADLSAEAPETDEATGEPASTEAPNEPSQAQIDWSNCIEKMASIPQPTHDDLPRPPIRYHF